MNLEIEVTPSRFDWTGKKVLVTGAGGFIGSHLVETLSRRGANVRALVRYRSDGGFGWLSGAAFENPVEIVQGDLRDLETVYRVVRTRDYVFHLGAMIAIPYSYVSPNETVATNVVGTSNVLTACRDLSIKKMVHTSTSEVYGTAQYVPIDEKHSLNGQSPYSASKIGADKLAESFFNAYALPITTIRPFNTYGPRQSARAVIPTIIAQALAGQEVKLGSLTPTRDFTFVSDTVEGMIRGAETAHTVGKTINLGTQTEITIGDLVKTISKLMETEIKIISTDDRKRPENSEVQRLLSNNSLAKELLGWTPAVSLTDGLSRTIDWLKHNQDAYERAKTTYVV